MRTPGQETQQPQRGFAATPSSPGGRSGVPFSPQRDHAPAVTQSARHDVTLRNTQPASVTAPDSSHPRHAPPHIGGWRRAARTLLGWVRSMFCPPATPTPPQLSGPASQGASSTETTPRRRSAHPQHTAFTSAVGRHLVAATPSLLAARRITVPASQTWSTPTRRIDGVATGNRSASDQSVSAKRLYPPPLAPGTHRESPTSKHHPSNELHDLLCTTCALNTGLRQKAHPHA